MKTFWLAVFCGYALSYAAIAFVFQNFNVTTWSEGTRVCVLLLGIPLAAVSGWVTSDHKEADKAKGCGERQDY